MSSPSRGVFVVLLTIIIVIALASILVSTSAQEGQATPSTVPNVSARTPPPPQAAIPVEGASQGTVSLSEEEKQFIETKAVNDPLVRRLAERAGGVKEVGSGVVVTDDNGEKVGGCAGVELVKAIWVDLEYKSIFGGERERYSGLTDNIMVCIYLDSGEVIGYYLNPRSITVRGADELPKDLEPVIRAKLTEAIDKAGKYVAQNYGIAPAKYRIKGAEDGVLIVIAYLSDTPETSESAFHEVEAVIIKFDFRSLKILGAEKEVITIVDSTVFQSNS